MISIKALQPPDDRMIMSGTAINGDLSMVEKTHTAGWLPHMYEPFRNIGTRIANWFAPASEASTAGDVYEIDLELPGVKADDISVSVDGNNLTIKGEKHSERTEEGRTYFFSEREYGAFLRNFRLPPDADTESVSAECRDGVLSLRIPKHSTEQEAAKQIKVQSAS